MALSLRRLGAGLMVSAPPSRVLLDPLTVILVGVSAALQAVTTALALSSRGVFDGIR
ncbi:hypothetical protein H7347_00130 [Corynebacterium sp. zg-331]|uniref:hypothetical protein n=1 Tax=unclassified Corynebacterium TaxID=2624378 RepID=UPI0016434A69|nr:MULTISPECIES: hypothetical protein [unclassified Corynebacterium]MBC3185005.1 hypothetical protein [Corynebacterium sp. zg-331]